MWDVTIPQIVYEKIACLCQFLEYTLLVYIPKIDITLSPTGLFKSSTKIYYDLTVGVSLFNNTLHSVNIQE